MAHAHSPSPAAGSTPHEHAGEHDHPGLTLAVEKQKGKAAVKMTLAAAELERARGREFAALSRRVALKGFRPGKTPRVLLERHFSAEVEKTVVEHFLQHAYQDAVEQHELRPAAYPRIALEDNLPKKGEDWIVSFEILLRPEFELGPVDGLEIEGQKLEVTDDELDRALVEIRRGNSRAEEAGDEPLASEGVAVATLDFVRPGASESCLTREGLRLVPKAPPPGVDPATFTETLTGARKGDTRALEMEFPANFPLEEARGEKGTLRITITQVFRIVPPSDEELYRAFEASDPDTLRASVRTRMLKGKQESEEQRIENELLERLLAEHPMELPAQLVADQVEAQQTELIENLKQQGVSEEEARQRAEGEKARAHTSAERALRAVYLIEEIARVKELKVTQEDVGAELAAIAARNATTAAEVAKYYRENDLLRQLGLELLERKVRRYLRASAAVRLPS